MKYLMVLIFTCLSSCQSLPQLYQAAEDIADDTAIKVEVSKEIFQKETDLSITINIQNKDDSLIKTESGNTLGK